MTKPKPKTDAELAGAVRKAMDDLCRRMWEAAEAGLHVECHGFAAWYGAKEFRGPTISIKRGL